MHRKVSQVELGLLLLAMASSTSISISPEMILVMMMMTHGLRNQVMVMGQRSKRHCKCHRLRKMALVGELRMMRQSSWGAFDFLVES